MTDAPLPTALSTRATRSLLRDVLSPDAAVSPHDRQRALVQASLLTHSPSDRPRRRRGWVPG